MDTSPRFLITVPSAISAYTAVQLFWFMSRETPRCTRIAAVRNLGIRKNFCESFDFAQEKNFAEKISTNRIFLC